MRDPALLGRPRPATLRIVSDERTSGPVVVAGAGGNVGGEVVRALAAAGAPVRALVRSAAPADLPSAAEALVADLDRPETLRPALDGAEAAFLLPGFSDMPGVMTRIRDAGLRRVVLLSGSSAAEDGDRNDAVTRYMRESEAAVRAGGVAWTILRPSGFMTNALEWAGQLRAGDLVRAPFAGVAIAVIDPYDIAAVAAAALLRGGHEEQALRLTGPEALRPADRVRILGEALGRDLRFEGQPDDETHAEMSARMPPQYVDAFFSFYVEGKLDESVVLPTVEEVCGRPPRTFAQWAAAHAGAFR
jgi:uncharacterized protein YbjT (DUF2867 family)